MKTCTHCELSKPDTDFPYLVKGKQPPNAPRQDVCKRCRSVLHGRKYEQRVRAGRSDVGIRDKRTDYDSDGWKMTPPQERDIKLMYELWDVRDMTDSAWLDLCAEAVAV